MRPFKLTLILVFISFLQACATDSVGGYGWHSNAFVEKGWIEVDRFEPGNNTAFDRIDYERETKGGIDELIKAQGYPDYYMTTDLWDVYYGYLGTGLIYH